MPNPGHNPTDGLLSAAFVQVSGTNVVANKTVGANKPNPGNYSLTMSLTNAGGFASTTQLTPTLEDVANNNIPLASLVLTAAAAAAGGVQVLTGTITGGAANAYAGYEVTVSGFGNALNNGTFLVTASTATTITVANATGAAETHAGTVQFLVGTVLYKSLNNPNAGTPTWYHPSPFSGYAADVVSVSAGGLITALALGQAVVEVSFPVFDNSMAAQSGLAGAAIYTQIVVTVIP